MSATSTAPTMTTEEKEILAIFGLTEADIDASTDLVSVNVRCAWCEPGLDSGVSHCCCAMHAAEIKDNRNS